MVNKAVIGRRLYFSTAEIRSHKNHSCREYDEKTRNFLNIKIDYRSKEEENLMIGPNVHQLYFGTMYRPGLKFCRAKLQGKGNF